MKNYEIFEILKFKNLAVGVVRLFGCLIFRFALKNGHFQLPKTIQIFINLQKFANIQRAQKQTLNKLPIAIANCLFVDFSKSHVINSNEGKEPI